MSQTPREATTRSDEIPREILVLAAAIGELPPDVQTSLQPLVENVLNSAKRRRRILQLVQDALSQLRLDMKYLMFDLEATRRERDDFRRQLEDA